LDEGIEASDSVRVSGVVAGVVVIDGGRKDVSPVVSPGRPVCMVGGAFRQSDGSGVEGDQ